MMIVNLRPNRYGLKYLVAQTMARSSFSITLNFSSLSFRVREAYAMGLSEPIGP